MQVKNGLIGDVVSSSAHWDQGHGGISANVRNGADMEYCIRNWFNIKWLSGDHLLDQAIHNIDVVTWFYGRPSYPCCWFRWSHSA